MLPASPGLDGINHQGGFSAAGGAITKRRLLEIEGARAIDMRDFGLPPPSFLMFKMQPEVQVKAKLVAKREG